MSACDHTADVQLAGAALYEGPTLPPRSPAFRAPPPRRVLCPDG